MSNISENNKRIAKNTMVLYVRMFVMMLISFFTAGITLNALGVDDYGINNVVGGLVSMFSLLSNSLTSATGRFITFSLGKGDFDEQKRVFSTAVNIHVILAIVVVLAIETVGVWFLNNRMNIPPDRLYAANWVLQCSTISFAISLFSVPYNSLIYAYERMSAFAWFTIYDAITKLIIIASIYYYGGDKLILLAIISLIPGVIKQVIYWIYCRRHFPESEYHFIWDKTMFKDMFSFSFWNFIGGTAGLLKDQGVNILINLFTAPAVNAARGIAMQLNGMIGQFSGSFMGAFMPQVTKYYASGDLTEMHKLMFRGTRFSYYIFMFIAIPLFFEVETVLQVWLGQVPEHTVLFTRLALLLSLLEMWSSVLITAQNATGRIRNYQLVVGTILLLNFPLSYLMLYLGFMPEITLVVALVVGVACLIARLCFLRKTILLPVGDYLYQVVFNTAFVTLLSSVLPYLCSQFITNVWFNFFGVCIVSVISSLVVIYFVGCNRLERQLVVGLLLKFKSRFIKG
ncbi:MAG: lipopolysaccharide biosynthesis protein [Paludibacteraceae bacterium]|nr:lipopolysaccharide biosynthesis protein [Paludibacteraceae bacterium]